MTYILSWLHFCTIFCNSYKTGCFSITRRWIFPWSQTSARILAPQTFNNREVQDKLGFLLTAIETWESTVTLRKLAAFLPLD